MQSEYDCCMVMQNIAQRYVTKFINKTDERESPYTNYKTGFLITFIIVSMFIMILVNVILINLAKLNMHNVVILVINALCVFKTRFDKPNPL